MHDDVVFTDFIVSDKLTFTNVPQSIKIIQFLEKCRGVRHISLHGDKQGMSLLFIAKLCERVGYVNLDRITCDGNVIARENGKPLQTILDHYFHAENSLFFFKIYYL